MPSTKYLALSSNGTLYAAVRESEETWAIRSYRWHSSERRSEEMRGVLLPVTGIDRPVPISEDCVVRCGDQLFAIVGPLIVGPVIGARLAVGGTRRDVSEVSSTITRVYVIPGSAMGEMPFPAGALWAA